MENLESVLGDWWEDKDFVQSGSINVGVFEKGYHEFVIRHFSNYNEIGVRRRFVESEYFAVGGYKWAIRVYPNGQTQEAAENGDISIFISLKSECKAPLKAVQEMYIVDQSGEGCDWGYTYLDPIKAQERYAPPYTKRGSMQGRTDFINRATLERLRPSYLKDDCLKVRCAIGIFGSRIQDLPITKPPEPTIYRDFERLLKTKEGADVFFVVGDEIVCAHKCIVGAQSAVLRERFSYAHQPEEIPISRIEPKILKAMLWFIYTGTLVEKDKEDFGDSHAAISHSFLGKMLAAADYFALERLKGICESRILEKLSRESVQHLLELAEVCRATKLKATCLDFARENQADDWESRFSSLEISSHGEHSNAENCNLSRRKSSFAKKDNWPPVGTKWTLPTSLEQRKTKIN